MRYAKNPCDNVCCSCQPEVRKGFKCSAPHLIKMDIQTIAEHNVDMEYLPYSANILDIGCRGFLFANHMRLLRHNVVCVDIDLLEGGQYHRAAISNYNGKAGIMRFNDPQATRIKEGGEVECFTLPSFMDLVQIKFFDLIKIDVEGAEREIIMSLTKPPANQLSIEFHLHTGIYGMKEVVEMEDRLESLGYKIASHEMSEQHGAGANFWSSLFVL